MIFIDYFKKRNLKNLFDSCFSFRDWGQEVSPQVFKFVSAYVESIREEGIVIVLQLGAKCQ